MVLQVPQTRYPESDGQPMADNTKQFRWIVLIKENLEAIFADEAEVFIAGDLLWYPVKGDASLRVAPDVMVVFGRAKGDRGSYIQHREGDIAPQVVFEILSPGNTRTEMDKKLLFYERYGVEEYYLYDPERNDLSGWLRNDGDTAGRLDVIDPMAGWVSPRLGVCFDLSGEELVMRKPDGEAFRTLAEERSKSERMAAKLRELGIDPLDL